VWPICRHMVAMESEHGPGEFLCGGGHPITAESAGSNGSEAVRVDASAFRSTLAAAPRIALCNAAISAAFTVGLSPSVTAGRIDHALILAAVQRPASFFPRR
jgi:hypothetical protein